MDIAIIGGTGVYDPAMLDDVQVREIKTPYGVVSLQVGRYRGQEIAFLARHGAGHSVPPHLVNYRGNIWALKKLGVSQIIATTAVGSLNEKMRPNELVVPDQFLDFTKGRPSTFFEGGDSGVIHTDFTNPYCHRLCKLLMTAAYGLNVPTHEGGVYVCTEGPRFETPAEIRMFRQLGGDLVGMTSIPEAVLAREAEMCYATLSIVTNYAAGISPNNLTHMEVVDAMADNIEKLRRVLFRAIELIEAQVDCECQHALAEFGGFKL